MSQLIKFLDREEINRTGKKEGSDRYYKKFHTYGHLVTMLMKDKVISIEVKGSPLLLRRIFYYDHANDNIYEFLSNNFELEATAIADIYRQTWQTESLFKRLKQNFPLKYFLGESQNAIEIQIRVSLIAQLILLVIKERTKRRWAFSNMVSFISDHALTYINLSKFLDNPNVDWNKLALDDQNQLNIFQT